MLRGEQGVLIMPQTDESMVCTKHWLISKNKEYRLVYVASASGERYPVFFVNMGLYDRIIFRLTFKHAKEERVKVFA